MIMFPEHALQRLARSIYPAAADQRQIACESLKRRLESLPTFVLVDFGGNPVWEIRPIRSYFDPDL
jgi:hypothetical protein